MLKSILLKFLCYFICFSTSFNLNYNKQFIFNSIFPKKTMGTATMCNIDSNNPLGKHGENFKFLSVLRGNEDVYFPRIIPIAGVLGEVSFEEIMAPFSAEAPKEGNWFYDFSDPDSPQLGTFACPPSRNIHEAADPVGLIATNTQLNINLSISDEVECVVVVDRGDFRFDPDAFFAFRSPINTVEIGSCNKIPQGFEIIGRVVMTTVPFHTGMARKPTGFLEDETEVF